MKLGAKKRRGMIQGERRIHLQLVRHSNTHTSKVLVVCRAFDLHRDVVHVPVDPVISAGRCRRKGKGVAQASLRVPVQLPHAQLRAAQINFGPHLIVGADREAGGGGVTGIRESAEGECAEKGRLRGWGTGLARAQYRRWRPAGATAALERASWCPQ